MTSLTVSVLLQLVFLPVLMLSWQAFGMEQCRILWGLKTLALGNYFLAMYFLANWQLTSYFARYVFLVLFITALIYSGIRVWDKPLWVRPEGWYWVSPLVSLLVLLITMPLLVIVIRAFQIPDKPVELYFPMKGGKFYVAQGGSHIVMNGHMKVATPKLHEWRGQMWALDIVKLYASSNRAKGLFPKDLHAYAIFGTSLCTLQWEGCSGGEFFT